MVYKSTQGGYGVLTDLAPCIDMTVLRHKTGTDPIVPYVWAFALDSTSSPVCFRPSQTHPDSYRTKALQFC